MHSAHDHGGFRGSSRGRQHTFLLPHLIEDAALEDPEAVALRCRGSELTYGELWTRSLQVAHTLAGDGVVPGDRIGILLHKSLESAVAMYGIMFAGAVYVPLDPTAPSARSQSIIEDCGITTLMTGPREERIVRQLVASDAPIESVVGIGTDLELGVRSTSWDEVARREAKPLPIPTTEQDLAYILYTSGSTGTPKGIMHTHRSGLAWAEVTASVYGFGPKDRISNYAPLHFDLSTLDYFGAARAGATTVVIPEEHTRFPASLAKLLADEAVTVFYTVPLALVGLGAPGILEDGSHPDLRLVLFAGEPMPIKHLRTIMGAWPHPTFYNVYGPTETNAVTHYRVPGVPEANDQALSIGVPYPNVEALIVDAGGKPVEDSTVGELLIRAPTVMKGYWDRADLNADAFFTRARHGELPDVFHHTGDLVSLQPDGNLEFLGRKDRRIKARGNRVELDEVEAVLLADRDVHEAAVYALPDDQDSMQIHAEVTLSDSATSESTDILDRVRSVLPTYAVPSSLQIRTSFPRTSTGKLDRRMLEEAALAGQEGLA